MSPFRTASSLSAGYNASRYFKRQRRFNSKTSWHRIAKKEKASAVNFLRIAGRKTERVLAGCDTYDSTRIEERAFG